MNNLLFVLLSLLVIKNYNTSEIPISVFILILVAMLIGGELIGLVRNILVVNDIHLLRKVLNSFWQEFLISGEFKTSYNVFSIFKSFDFLKGHYFYGSTYIINPFITLIPKFLFPSRPLTIAQQFSFEYYGPGVSLGLGLSPIVEAIINFDIPGIIILFWVIGLLLRLLYLKFYKNFYYSNDIYKRYFGLIFYSIIFPTLINFFRIDFATLSKLFFMKIFWVYIFFIILRGVSKVDENKDSSYN